MVRMTLPPDHNDTDEMFKRTTYNPLPVEAVQERALTAIVVVLVLVIVAVVFGFAKFVGLL